MTTTSSTTTTPDEVCKAKAAVATTTANSDEKTVFEKMLDGRIPAKFIYEDDLCVAFDDIAPTAPVHFLVIPRKHLAKLDDASDDDELLLGHLMKTASRIACNDKGLAQDGYRLVVNNGVHGCQSVYHLHVHCIGGRQLGWPPGI